MTERIDPPEATTQPGHSLVVRSVQQTDVGRVRTENQDFAILSGPDDEARKPEKGKLMIVADGMGGHRGGATASRLAGVTIKSEYFASGEPDIPTSLKAALEKANARIFTEAQSNADLRGMGTTCSALVIRGNEAIFAHVGDSRIYLVRNGEISQLTEDHSLVASMVREGLLTSKEAEVHPRRNVLQRSMGVAEQVEIDVRSGVRIQPGDTFILCSDGLHGLVKEDEMREVAQMPVPAAAQEFVKRAIERGAPDNVTVIVARVEDVPEGTVDDDLHDAPTVQMPAIPDTMEMEAVTEPLPLTEPGASELPESAAKFDFSPPGMFAGDAAVLSMPATLPGAAATVPQAASAETAKKSGGVWKWLLIALIVIGAAGAAVVYWTQWGSPSAVSHESPLNP